MRALPLLLAAALAAGCLDDARGPAAPAAPVPSCPGPCAQTVLEGNLWEPHAAGNPADPRHLVAAFKAGRPGITTAVTRDGGATWQHGYLAVGEEAPAGSVLRQWTNAGDQVVAILPDGTVLVSALGLNFTQLPNGGFLRGGAEIVVARSFDGGLTFPEAAKVGAGSGQLLAPGPLGASARLGWDNQDKEWIAAGPDGTVLVAWTAIRDEAPAGSAAVPARTLRFDLRAAVSRDGGATWGPVQALAEDTSFAFTHPAVAADGSLAIAYGNGFGGDLVVYASGDGASWTATPSIGMTAGQPILKAHDGPDGPVLLLAYPALQGSGPAVPALRASRDGGRTWDDPVALADVDLGGPFAHLAMDVAPDGTAWVSWYRPAGRDALAYEAAALPRGGPPTPPVTLATGIAGPAGSKGDYVAMLSAAPGGALVGWIGGQDGADTLDFARVGLA